MNTDSSSQAEALLTDWLDLVAYREQVAELRREPFDCGALLQQALRHAPAPIEAALPPEPLWVLGDETCMERVLRHLLLHAHWRGGLMKRVAAELKAETLHLLLEVEGLLAQGLKLRDTVALCGELLEHMGGELRQESGRFLLSLPRGGA